MWSTRTKAKDCPNGNFLILNLVPYDFRKLRNNKNETCAMREISSPQTSMRAIWVPKHLVANVVGPNKCWVPRNACWACRLTSTFSLGPLCQARVWDLIHASLHKINIQGLWEHRTKHLASTLSSISRDHRSFLFKNAFEPFKCFLWLSCCEGCRSTDIV
jgi:hypothetical protein